MKTQLPSEHETERVQREREEKAQLEAAQRKAVQLRQAVDAILRSEHGRILWAYLFNVCGYNKTSMTKHMNGDVALLSTECKEAQRQIYMVLRKLAAPELLIRTEFFAEFGEELSQKGEVKNGQ